MGAKHTPGPTLWDVRLNGDIIAYEVEAYTANGAIDGYIRWDSDGEHDYQVRRRRWDAGGYTAEPAGQWRAATPKASELQGNTGE